MKDEYYVENLFEQTDEEKKQLELLKLQPTSNIKKARQWVFPYDIKFTDEGVEVTDQPFDPTINRNIRKNLKKIGLDQKPEEPKKKSKNVWGGRGKKRKLNVKIHPEHVPKVLFQHGPEKKSSGSSSQAEPKKSELQEEFDKWRE